MESGISAIWEALENEGEDKQDPALRIYRALGDSAIGIRAGFIPRDRILELLIEIPPSWIGAKSLPDWRGMRFEVLPISMHPREEAHHLRFYLDDHEHKPVFLTFCEDVVSSLEGISDTSIRIKEIEECITRWNRFFEKCGPGGLSLTRQRGLFAELVWIENLLKANTDPADAITSWKGCERGYHDFDLNGDTVEVKSTITKEPRRVQINNERQLDDSGLKSLHLFVLTLHVMDGGGITLPDQVQVIRDIVVSSTTALSAFERCLVSAGYLDKHSATYNSHYALREQELFRITEGFPRIIDFPGGVGHLSYSVTLSACQSYSATLSDYLNDLRSG